MGVQTETTTELAAESKRALVERLLRERAAERGPVPLSFAQERLWFLDRLQPGLPVYNLGTSLPINGEVDIGVLERSLEEVVRRHAVLRTTFATVEGRPVQVIAEDARVALGVVDLRPMPASTRWAEAQRLAIRESQRPFDLAHGPLFRATVLRVEGGGLLLLTMHHIVSDGWSLGVLMRELTALYDAYLAGRPSPLPELKLQYAEYVRWQRHWLQGEVLERQLAYWRHRLADAPELLDLPTDRLRPAMQSFAGAWRAFVVGAPLCEGIRSLSRRCGVTPYMTLLAAFQTLLHRYSGQDDVLIGTPIANRTRVEHETLVGFFANTLVIRADLGGNPRFLDLLERVREATLGAYAHQDLPFEKLVEELQPARHLSHHPLFQVMFAYQNVPLQPGRAAPAIAAGPVAATAKFDLSLSLEERESELQGTIEYNTDLFHHARMARLVGHFETLLSSIVAAPDARLSDLPLLTEAERRQLLVSWPATEVELGGAPLLHHLVEAQAAQRPAAMAVVRGEACYGYDALNRRANRLAHYLRGLGVGPEVRVGLCVERSPEMVVGLLGILKAGGAYLPLDPAYPAERLSFMLEDAGVSVLVSEARLAAALPGGAFHRVFLDAEAEAIAACSEADPASGVLPDNLAYVIHTSGSTGTPKGVMVSHAAAVNLLRAVSRAAILTSEDTLLAVTTLSFDIAALEVFLPLSLGARVAIAPRDASVDGAALIACLKDAGATAMQATPVTWRLLLAAGWRGEPPLKVLCGGEALPRELARELLARSARVWNLYGPTETTIWTAIGPVTGEDGPIDVGRPLANTQTYVLDRCLDPVPVGVTGELYVGGAGLARGYLHRPEQTAERFIPHPVAAAGERLYRTGDLARYLEDGRVEILGRTDAQVKIRGFRIEPGEIETVLQAHPDVADAVVVARAAAGAAANAAQDLVAYVLPRSGEALDAGALQDFLRRKLPDYMVPAAFLGMAAFPVTPAGKIDRRALPAPDMARPAARAAFLASRDPVEEVLAGVWADLLGLERVGALDNFFDLGGHSLLATQAMSRLSEAFQRELPVLLLFEHPTVGELGAALRNDPSAAVKIEKAAELLLRIAAMSDEEVEARLNREARP